MTAPNFNQLVSFIFGIANDCLVDKYDVGDYRKIILPMTVIRRFDAVLEPTKQAVLEMKKKLDAAGVREQDQALCRAAGQAFCNRSPFTLTDLRSRKNLQTLKQDFIAYLDGFSANVQDIIDKFKFRQQIDYLVQKDILGILIAKYTDATINLSSQPVLNDDGSERLPALDNHTMGTVFEEVIRKFNEETNITDAGRHFTPRDIVELMADLAFVPVQDAICDTTYRIYDGACGTGGMLTVAGQRIEQIAAASGKRVSIKLYGQEIADETYAIARADMLIKGEGAQAEHIFYGSTISNDGFSGETFDFMLSNPPFGTPWKTDLEAWGNIKKEEICDPRFVVTYNGAPLSLVPDIGDPQMLFLANNISKMKTTTTLGSRIVQVHNGSSLFTGKAGQGPSNLRQYILENDLLEAIVALPEKMFYNTGIGTYLWILSNNKEPRRCGKVQLIDATALKSPMRKNLGEKNCQITPDIRAQILKLHADFDKADAEYSRVFDNAEFGYWTVDVHRPLRLAARITDEAIETLRTKTKDPALAEALATLAQTANAFDSYDAFEAAFKPLARGLKLTAAKRKHIRAAIGVADEKADPVVAARFDDEMPDPLHGIFDAPNGKDAVAYESDPELKDTEQIPFTYPGGIEAFVENEVRPYAPDAWIDQASIKTGYELSFTKYFYKPVQLRSLDDIANELAQVEREMHGLLDEIMGD